MIYFIVPPIVLLILLAVFIPIIRRHRLFEKNRRQLEILMEQRGVDFVIFDVRDYNQYEEKHLKEAVSFPQEQMNHLPLEDMFIHIFIYGNNPKQSRWASAYLSDRGYFNVHNIGSFQAWKGSLEEGPGTSVEELEETILKRKQNERL